MYNMPHLDGSSLWLIAISKLEADAKSIYEEEAAKQKEEAIVHSEAGGSMGKVSGGSGSAKVTSSICVHPLLLIIEAHTLGVRFY